MTIKKPKRKQKLPALYNKAGKLLQGWYRSKHLACVNCEGPSTVVHHFAHWSTSVALRFEDMNLVPLCQGCHFKWHKSAPLEMKKHIEDYMKGQYGDDWEDKLREIDRTAPHKTTAEKRDELLKLIEFYGGYL